jgi:hypothetical protein
VGNKGVGKGIVPPGRKKVKNDKDHNNQREKVKPMR